MSRITSCSLIRHLQYWCPAIVFLGRGHPCHLNPNATVPINVVRLKRYVNSLFKQCDLAGLVGMLQNGGCWAKDTAIILLALVARLQHQSPSFANPSRYTILLVRVDSSLWFLAPSVTSVWCLKRKGASMPCCCRKRQSCFDYTLTTPPREQYCHGRLREQLVNRIKRRSKCVNDSLSSCLIRWRGQNKSYLNHLEQNDLRLIVTHV